MQSVTVDAILGGMAELPVPPSDRLPAPVAPPGELFDRAHSYGAAHDLERMRAGLAPLPRPPRARTRSRRFHGPVDLVRHWWANSSVQPADVWHRLRCRRGHHEFRGGERVQLGSRFVFIERRCAWCDAAPSP